MIGIAVLSQELKLVSPSNPEPVAFAYGKEALAAILAQSQKGEAVLISGNRRWALTIAYALHANGREVRYLARPRGERGSRQDLLKTLKRALERGFTGHLFFKEQPAVMPPAPHPWVELGNRYFLLMSEIRRTKHRIINCLRVLYPELISLEEKLWTKNRLENLTGLLWQEFSADGVSPFEKSLGRFLPQETQREAETEIRKLVENLAAHGGEKEQLQEKIAGLTLSHPVTKFFGERVFSGKLLALFCGWRTWGTARNSPQGFRAVRHFAGLDVSRMDSKGKMRISRARPNVRTALYWALRSARGKEITSALGRAPRPKRLERLLLAVWRAGLKDIKS